MPRLLFVASAALALLLAPAVSLAHTGQAQAGGTDPIDVQGQWDGTIHVTSGPGTGSSDDCTITIAQDGASISGSSSCARSGPGAGTGTLDGSTFQLTVSNRVFGTLAVTATVASDGTQATGTFVGGNGSRGTYAATREQPPAGVPAGDEASPDDTPPDSE